MAREVDWTESASDDLAEIASYIAKDSEVYAAAVVRELIEAARLLDKFAQRGRMVPEYRDPYVRELVVRDYRLVYQITEAAVHVLRIVHGARKLPTAPPSSR
jgi:addiction module RelE/StbE family toxin